MTHETVYTHTLDRETGPPEENLMTADMLRNVTLWTLHGVVNMAKLGFPAAVCELERLAEKDSEAAREYRRLFLKDISNASNVHYLRFA